MNNSLLFKDNPYEDELLSSWLTRLAHINYLSLSSFLGAYFPRKKYAIHDLDLYEYPESFFNKISELTNLPIQKIKDLQLYQYEGIIEEKINITGRHKWFAALHSNNRENKFYGTRICPYCLKENAYIKKSWRIIYLTICFKHKIYLHNNCPKCNSPISFTKTSNTLQINNCFKCNFDLTNLDVSRISEKSLDYYYQNLLYDITKKGYYIFQNRCYYSIGLFNILRILTRNIIKTNIIYKKTYIEEYEPIITSKIISNALRVLENYPKNLIHFCKKNKLTNEPNFYDKNRYKKKEIPSWFYIK